MGEVTWVVTDLSRTTCLDAGPHFGPFVDKAEAQQFADGSDAYFAHPYM